jgi:hypothetical protein
MMLSGVPWALAAGEPTARSDGYSVFAVKSDTGRDSFRRIADALSAARAFRRTHPAAAIRIEIAPGNYYLDAPLEIGSDLSGSKTQPTEIVAATSAFSSAGSDKTVRLMAGRQLKLHWKRFRDGIMQAHVAGPAFDQLYVDGAPQVRARYPNYDAKAVVLNGYAADALAPSRVARWKDPAGAIVHALHEKRWGGLQVPILGKRADGSLEYGPPTGNNRPSPPHPTYRFVENVFEELDAPGEWFFDKAHSLLYFFPPRGVDLRRAAIEVGGAPRVFDLQGDIRDPLRHVLVAGLSLLHTGYSFPRANEPLVRSDWMIAREAAVYLEHTEDIEIENNDFSDLGGTAILVSGYNRRVRVSGNHIHDVAGGGIYFIGRSEAVRSASFRYEEFIPLDKIDLEPGPKSDDYPADSIAEDNLIHRIGRVEKQAAGIDIDIAANIHLAHNSIYEVPRAGINIGDGAFGGHVIEFNDVFDTVLETGDHGAFNAWGRDRHWHPDRALMDKINAEHPGLWKLDSLAPITLRNNRFRCDHGWDIDLDDGASNYRVTDNVLLGGGLKFREGFDREATNNILINSSFHPHVWFAHSGDLFERNIVLSSYQPILMKHWDARIDYNLFPNETALDRAHQLGLDAHSRYGDPQFVDAANGDYRLEGTSPALALGFRNFRMDEFGVTAPRLRALASRAPIPQLVLQSDITADRTWTILGAQMKTVSSPGEQSAAGLAEVRGVLVLEVPRGSIAAKSGLEANDAIVELSPDEFDARSEPIHNAADLLGLIRARSWRAETKVIVIRNQQRVEIALKTAQE